MRRFLRSAREFRWRRSHATFPLTKELLPAFRAQEAGRAYALAVEILIDGLARRAGGRGAG